MIELSMVAEDCVMEHGQDRWIKSPITRTKKLGVGP